MNNLWTAVSWATVRASGFTAYFLLMFSVITGLALSLRWQSWSRWPRIINNELHNFLTLLSLIFTVVHVLTSWFDPFIHFGWKDVFIPFATHYRTLWMAAGIVSLYLGLAIGLSTWLRPFIGYVWWRRIHVLTIATFALVVVHGVMTGSDSANWWVSGLYIGSVLFIAALLAARLLRLVLPQKQ